VSGITVQDDDDPTDVSASYAVEVSMDGNCWDTVAGSTCAAPTDLTVTFSPVMARFVRYVNTAASSGGFWWSIDEISVQCGTPPAMDGGVEGGTEGANDGSSDASSLDATLDAN